MNIRLNEYETAPKTVENNKSKKVIWLTIEDWYWSFKLDCSSECDPIHFHINPKFEWGFNLQSTIISVI